MKLIKNSPYSEEVLIISNAIRIEKYHFDKTTVTFAGGIFQQTTYVIDKEFDDVIKFLHDDRTKIMVCNWFPYSE